MGLNFLRSIKNSLKNKRSWVASFCATFGLKFNPVTQLTSGRPNPPPRSSLRGWYPVRSRGGSSRRASCGPLPRRPSPPTPCTPPGPRSCKPVAWGRTACPRDPCVHTLVPSGGGGEGKGGCGMSREIHAHTPPWRRANGSVKTLPIIHRCAGFMVRYMIAWSYFK